MLVYLSPTCLLTSPPRALPPVSRVRGHHEVVMPRLGNVAAARSARGLLLCSGDLKEQHRHGAWLPVSNMRIALQQQKEQLQDDVCSRAAHKVLDKIPLLLNACEDHLFTLWFSHHGF